MASAIRFLASFALIALCELIAVVGPMRAADAASQRAIESERIVRSTLARSHGNAHLRVTQQRALGSVALCAEACDLFAWEHQQSAAEIWDFVALYEHQRNSATPLGEAFRSQVDVLAPRLLMRYAQYCPARPDREAMLACVLDTLAQRNGIRIGFASHNVGARCFAWGDVSARARITRAECARNNA
jgi:hypothetical protein